MLSNGLPHERYVFSFEEGKKFFSVFVYKELCLFVLVVVVEGGLAD